MKKIGLLAVLILLIAACRKPDTYPDTPVITFKSISTTKSSAGYDVSSHVVISFTDGDGDIGYNSFGNGAIYDDTLSPYYSNFVVKVFQKKNGVWTADTIKLPGRIPYLTPEGNNKALKGDIAMDLPLPFGVVNDTMRYDIFIYDRALHQSNTVTTSEIIITTVP